MPDSASLRTELYDAAVKDEDCDSLPSIGGDIKLEIARGLDYNASPHFPWYEDDKEIRLPWVQQCYEAHDTSRLGKAREGLLVDCGAIDNLTGKNFVDRQSRIAELATAKKVEYEKRSSRGEWRW